MTPSAVSLMTSPARAAGPKVLWPEAPNDLHLHDHEVHVFCTRLEQSPARVNDLEELLSRDERSRADRFHFEEDRRRFVVCRGILREILGQLSQVPAQRLEFSYGQHGKPCLAGTQNGSGLRFNVAHAGSVAVYAMALRREVGVDVEQFRQIDDTDNFVERFFSQRELADWNSVPEDLRTEAFFIYWTRKEACLKATGQGLSVCLGQIEVSLIPGAPARVISDSGTLGQPNRWWLQSLSPAPGYTGAVAATSRGLELRLRQWEWPGHRAVADI